MIKYTSHGKLANLVVIARLFNCKVIFSPTISH